MGFREIHQRTLDVARYMAREIEKIGLFRIYEDARQIPIVCWALEEDADVQWSLYDLADRLRMAMDAPVMNVTTCGVVLKNERWRLSACEASSFSSP